MYNVDFYEECKSERSDCMITNFIFDLGNVLVDYNPMRCILKYVRNISDANYIASEVFASAEWAELDRGTMTYEQALKNWKARIPERLHESVCTVVDNFHRHLPEISGMTEIVKKLKESGKKIYILSNVSERFPQIVEGLEVMKYVDGAVLSHEEKTVKPEKEIYTNFFYKFTVKPEESVFIDDSPDNVRTAKAFGMAWYLYDGDVEKLANTFQKLGFFENL